MRRSCVRSGHNHRVRRLLLGVAPALLLSTVGGIGFAQGNVVRIGVPTKGYWPTVVAKAAESLKLFDKEGLRTEITVYRGAGEAFEALAADAADLVFVPPTLVAASGARGVKTSLVGGGSYEFSGWILAVKSGSTFKSVSELQGKKIGITSAGSGSDGLAIWAEGRYNTKFSKVPVGGAGLMPNLLNGNLDAAVLFAPVSHQGLNDKSIRVMVDFAKEMPRNLAGGWATTDKALADRPQVIRAALNALYGAVIHLQDHRDYAVNLIAQNSETSPALATMEYEGTILKLNRSPEVTLDSLVAAIDLARLIGAKDLTPPDKLFRTVNVKPTRP